ncbi:MAG TPA: type II toxin-antitoxin system prevent-host-death family antitoxin [Burkholderiaceae bacterium]|nr:type II toxin-antitoxin system prevent-host-death family antitoxin [Burkholderiaceae bacterium]
MKPTLIAAEPVSAYDAKTHLPKLLERAAKGERFVITRHGRPVAQLIPFDNGDEAAIRSALEKVGRIRRKLERQGIGLGSILGEGETARELAHGGHRY